MNLEARTAYLKEVLGVEPPLKDLVVSAPQVLVFTHELSEEEQILFGKILAAAGLKEAPVQVVSQIPQDIESAQNFVVFSDTQETGLRQLNGVMWCWLPSIASMLGASPEVAARKKEAWELLKKFTAEMP